MRVKVLLMLTAAAVLLNGIFCGSPKFKKDPDPIRFALLGNTVPDSPFTGLNPKVETVIGAISGENPIFTIHLGNIVYGGKEWMGIKPSDVERQFREFHTIIRKQRLILYTVKGEMDEYNGSPLLYSIHTGRPPYYSFNYGNVHFVVLHTSDPAPGTISDIQMRWLAADLENSRNSAAVFILTHHPLLPPLKKLYGDQGVTVKKPEPVISLLGKYPVKAVISGSYRGYYSEIRSGIRFIIAGCGGYTKEYNHWRYNQYYLVLFNGNETLIIEKKTN